MKSYLHAPQFVLKNEALATESQRHNYCIWNVENSSA